MYSRDGVVRKAGAYLLSCLLVALVSCGGGDKSTTTTGPSAETVEVVGCTTLRLRGQNFEVTACRTSPGPLTTVTIGGNCTVIIGCLSNGCIASGGSCR